MGNDSILASLQVLLGADITDYEAKMGKTWKAAQESLDKLKDFGEGMSLYVTAPIVAATTAIVIWTAEQETADAILSASLHNVTDGYRFATSGIHDYIMGLSEMSGFKDIPIEQAFTELVNITHSANTALGALPVAMDVAAGTGRDLSSVALAIGRAIDGSTTALARMGIQIQKNATPTQILAALTRGFGGDAAAMADTIQGKWNQMQVKFEEVAKTIGTALGPMIKQVEDWALALISYGQEAANWFKAQPTYIQELVVALVALVAAAGPVIVAITTVVGGFIALAAGVAALGGLAGIAATIGGIAAAFFTAAVPILAVVAAFFGAAYAGIFFRENIGKMADGVEGIFFTLAQSIGNWAAGFLRDLASLASAIPGWGDKIAGHINGVADSLQGFADKSGIAAQKAADDYEAAGGYMENTSRGIASTWDDIKNIIGLNTTEINASVDGMKPHFDGAAANLTANQLAWKKWAEGVKPTVQSLATSIIGDFASIASEMATSLAKGTFDAKAIMINFLTNMIGQIVQFQILSMLGFQTMSQAIAVAFANPVVAAVAIGGMIALVAGLEGQFGSLHLAKGGMSTGETLATIGDNPSGKEIVMPLDSPQTTNALAKAMPQGGGVGEQTIILQIGEETIAQAAVRGFPAVLRLSGVTNGS